MYNNTLGHRVLIAESNDELRWKYAKSFISEGYETYFVGNSAEAEHFYFWVKPDLLVVDSSMYQSDVLVKNVLYHNRNAGILALISNTIVKMADVQPERNVEFMGKPTRPAGIERLLDYARDMLEDEPECYDLDKWTERYEGSIPLAQT